MEINIRLRLTYRINGAHEKSLIHAELYVIDYECMCGILF